MDALTEIRVFMPQSQGAVQWLYGLKRYRKEKGDLTVVVLGGAKDISVNADRLRHLAAQHKIEGEDGEKISLDWLGCCCSEGNSLWRPTTSSFWIEWVIETGELRLDTIDVGAYWDASTPLKVFHYEPAMRGRLHYPSSPTALHGAQQTAMELAVSAIHKGYRIRKAMQNSDRDCLSRMPSIFPFLLCTCFSESVSASQSHPFETGRLIQKWRESIPPHRRSGSTKANIVSSNEAVIWAEHVLFARAIQVATGIALTVCCIYWTQGILFALQGYIDVFCEFLKRQSAWLSGTPAGLKLHKPLANFYAFSLSQAARTIFVYQTTLLGVLWNMWIPLWICSGFFGISIQLALCSDLLYLFQLPLSLVYAGFSLITFVHVKCLILTWKLLRGQFAREKRRRKSKPGSSASSLRSHFGKDEKSKDDEVLMEHLIVGVLLFTPLLALMPTSLLFFCFLLGLQLSTAMLRSVLAFCMNLSICNPSVLVGLRLYKPFLFPAAIAIQPLREGAGILTTQDGGTTQICCWHYTMQSVPVNVCLLLKRLLLSCVERLWQIDSITIPGISFGKIFGLRP